MRIISVLLFLLFTAPMTLGSVALAQTPPPCYDVTSSIYNTGPCQMVRDEDNKDRTEQAQKAQVRQECDAKKSEGFVWIVFMETCSDFKGFGGLMIDYILTISSLIAGVMFVVASFKYLTSRGDASKLADAKDMMIQATIGIILIASAFVIIQVINGAFGITSSGEGVNLLPFFDLP